MPISDINNGSFEGDPSASSIHETFNQVKGVLPDYLLKGGYVGNAQDLKDEIDLSNSLTGTERYATLAEVNALGTKSVTVQYIVDSDGDNNGFYTWDGISATVDFNRALEVDVNFENGNIFEITNIVEQSLIGNTSGNISSNNSWIRTGAIPVSDSINYVISGNRLDKFNFYSSDTLTAANWLGLGVTVEIRDQVYRVTPPSGATHLAFNMASNTNQWGSTKNRLQVIEGDLYLGVLPSEQLIEEPISAAQFIYKVGHDYPPSFLTDIREDQELVLIQSGQSNYTDLEPNSNAPLDELGIFNSLELWDINSQSFLAYEKDFIESHNLNLGLARMLSPYNIPIKIINVSTSATDINDHISGGVVYELLWSQVQNAINQILSNGKNPVVFFHFIQGEANSNSQELADVYGAKQLEFLNQWRDNLGANLPMIMSTIYERGNAAAIALDKQINDLKRNLYKDGLIQGLIEVEDFPSDDDLHRNYQGFQREARALIGVLSNIRSGIIVNQNLPFNY